MPKKKEEPPITVTVEFSITVPAKAGEKGAIQLMEEAVGFLENECDNAEGLFESAPEILGDDYGYSFGFGEPKIV